MSIVGVVETREVFEGLGWLAKTAFYEATTIAVGLFAYGWWRRTRKYTRGRPAGRLRRQIPPNRQPDRHASGSALVPAPKPSRGRRPLGRSLGMIATNSTVQKRDRAAGIAHFFVFWGFITLFIGTVILTIDADIVRHATRIVGGKERSFFKGAFYLGYSIILDVMGVLAVVSLLYLIVRRWALHKPALDYGRAQQPEGGYSREQYKKGDWVFLGALLVILLTGFAVEALRIRANHFPGFETWSPVGWWAAKGLRGAGVGAAAAASAHRALWWAHALFAFGFVVFIPFSKGMHMVTDVANLVTADPESARRLPAPVAGADHVGYRSIDDFTWKELLDFDACTKCGRCHVACPATASGAPLSPRDLILDLRQWVDINAGGLTLLDDERRPTPTGPLAPNGSTPVAGGVIARETLWSCTTCMACVEACPVGIEHVSTIVQMRRSLVDEGEMEPTLQGALQNIAQQGNSFGKSSRMRARWTKGLDFTIKDARKEPVELLWFVGDFAAFDERLQEVSRTLAQILHEAGVDFGILYDDEWNAGNDVRRVGEEGLFELLVEHNVEALKSAEFQAIFTTDPHSFNTLRNEYPDYGLDARVMHYTQVLADLLETGAIPVRPLDVNVTYHDPCYLARYNRVTDAPRRVLRSLGCELVEMPRNRENTFCCGAGGGRIWMDDSGLTERPSENRIREAAALDVERFVVACPKDYTMYSDAAKTTGHDERIRVVDLVQLVAEARIAAAPELVSETAAP